MENLAHARGRSARRLLGWGPLAAVLGVTSMLGCNPPPAPPEPSREARAEAAQIFSVRCSSCHGPLGKGDGPRASKLSRRPRNFADPTWQLAVSDKHLEKVILGGGTAVGKSPDMPANPDLASKPEVLMALRQHVRVLAYAP
jgi:mono/diheme cytochrome c family protein